MAAQGLYIPLHTTVRGHRKTKRAAAALGITVPTMVGHLACLWAWAVEYEPSGRLTGYSEAEIAENAAWEGDPVAFVNALTLCGGEGRPGYLDVDEDGTLSIHDQADYGGKVLTSRERNAARQQAFRDRQKASPDATSLSNADVTVTSPLRDDHRNRYVTGKKREEKTREDQSKSRGERRSIDPTLAANDAPADAGRALAVITATPNGNGKCNLDVDVPAPDPHAGAPAPKPLSPLTKAQQAEFDRWWPIYPKKAAKKQAAEQWRRTNPDGALTDEIIAGTERQKQSRKWSEGFVPDPHRFLRDERWRDEPEPAHAAGDAPGGQAKPIKVMSDRSRENLRVLLATEQLRGQQ